MLGISGRALSKITSSFMVIGNDGQKTNLGLSLKFEAKALKVVNYSRKNGRYWEFSEKAVNLIREYKVTLFSGKEFLFLTPWPRQHSQNCSKLWMAMVTVRDFNLLQGKD